jgi:hypothetical protein
MYIEHRGPDDRLLWARIARVAFSRTGRTAYLDGRSFSKVGRGQYWDAESGQYYWFSGPRKDGNDRGGNRQGSFPVNIDEDARIEYWTQIRDEPARAQEGVTYG